MPFGGVLTAGRRKRLVPAALSLFAALGAAGCGSSTSTASFAGLPPIPQWTPGNAREMAYLSKASEFVANDKECAPRLRRRSGREVAGSPSQTMLSSFAVLKLPKHAALPHTGYGGLRRVYVNYVRVAQTRFGWPFKVIPIGFYLQSPQCDALYASKMHTILAHAPANVRAKAFLIGHEEILDDRYIERHPEGICVYANNEGNCETLLGIRDLGELGIVNQSPAPVSYDLVPNGVASVTVRYPKQPGFSARTISVRVIHNLAVWKAPSDPANRDIFLETTVLWRAANGQTIRTIRPS